MKKYIIRLTNEECCQLIAVINKGKGAAYKIKHANIMLKADADGSGWTDEQIAKAFSVHWNTVRNVRQRFVEQGLEAALNRKKLEGPFYQQIIDGEVEAKLIALSCSEPPSGYGRWTLRLLAEKAVELLIVDDISYETVRKTLKKTS